MLGYFFLSPATWTGDYSLLYSVLLELSNFILYVVESSVLLRVCLPTAGLCAPPSPPSMAFCNFTQRVQQTLSTKSLARPVLHSLCSPINLLLWASRLCLHSIYIWPKVFAFSVSCCSHLGRIWSTANPAKQHLEADAENMLRHIMQSQRPAQMSVPSDWNFTSFPLMGENGELLLRQICSQYRVHPTSQPCSFKHHSSIFKSASWICFRQF